MEPRYKYPRTPHLPWSPGVQKDDRISQHVADMMYKNVVVTEKMDGENTTLYSDGIHARSIDSRSHASRDWIKNLHGMIKACLPHGMRICGENLYAKHSIDYKDLPSYFMVFSIWMGETCLSWDDTVDLANEFGLQTVPVIYRGLFDKWCWDCYENAIRADQEGYVVRLDGSFSYTDFDKSVAKYVRKGHVQTDDHWMHRPVVPNKLRR